MWQICYEIAKKSSKIVPLGAPLLKDLHVVLIAHDPLGIHSVSTAHSLLRFSVHERALFSDIIRGQVRGSGKRHDRVAVAKDFRERVHISAVHREVRGERVSEIVEPEVRDACAQERRVPSLLHVGDRRGRPARRSLSLSGGENSESRSDVRVQPGADSRKSNGGRRLPEENGLATVDSARFYRQRQTEEVAAVLRVGHGAHWPEESRIGLALAAAGVTPEPKSVLDQEPNLPVPPGIPVGSGSQKQRLCPAVIQSRPFRNVL